MSVLMDAASLDVDRSVDGRVYMFMADMAVQLVVQLTADTFGKYVELT